ncbi:MAG: hypothetical protein HS115_06810 [Spirochaetales bacterium]|nr:hypothetical protein [Spirochaetales bacterium]
MLSGDFCFSGSLQSVARELARVGKKVIVLTSADATNISTENWTFSQTLIDCLAGHPLCDDDRDGTISLADMQAEVASAMLHRENQKSGFFSHGIGPSTRFGQARSRAGHLKGHYAMAPDQKNGNARPVRVLTDDGQNSVCEFYYYSQKEERRIPSHLVRPISFQSYPAGSRIQALWNGTYYPARILKQDGPFHFIHYDGYTSQWNEWITSVRIRLPQ